MSATEWLRVNTVATGQLRSGVDRSSRVIHGVILAQAGEFKDGRGLFNADSLRQIRDLANKAESGLKSRFAHPSLSNDGIGSYLGRMKSARLDTESQPTTVYGDLHLGEASSKSPDGDLAEYVMSLAEEDPEAFGTSLVLHTKKLNPETYKDWEGEEDLIPLWMPTQLHASDVVDDGDATRSFLSVDPEGLRDRHVRQATEILDRTFSGMSADDVRARCEAFLGKYLARRFGEETMASDNATPAAPAVPAPDPTPNQPDNQLGTKPLVPPVPDLSAATVRAELIARNRNIREYCRLHACTQEETDAFLDNPDITEAQVLEKLTRSMATRRQLSDGAPGGGPTDTDPDQALREKYRSHPMRSQLANQGITEDKYVELQKKLPKSE